MLHPAVANFVTYFYPVGNTPATCLTQDVPREIDANVLLLGCGDVRKILFTTFLDNGLSSRRLDITCCDNEAAILATHGDQENTKVWNIGYHLYLDDASSELLEQQVELLLSHAENLGTWHKSTYGKWLRFCNARTFSCVRDIWASYKIPDSDKQTYRKRFEAWIDKARQNPMFDHMVILNTTSVRSAGPVGMEAIKETPLLFQKFWKNGTTDDASGSQNPNPTIFSNSGNASTLHYGTDPLLGFHLALAYVTLTAASPLNGDHSGATPRAILAARHEFREWCKKFSKFVERGITIRLFSGDALSLCQALSHRRISEDLSNWYCDQYVSEPVVLDSKDYDGDAPLTFNVIDTSNLADHLGGINLLTATTPLLDESGFAVLYVDTLVKKESSQEMSMDNLLCGDTQTICALFGLTPTEYWTNSTATSNVEDHLMEAVGSIDGEKHKSGQLQGRLVLKRLAIERSHLDPQQLAELLYGVYLNMFQCEDMKRQFSQINLFTLQSQSNIHYHRGGFVSLLASLRRNIATDWDQTLKVLLGLIENDGRLLMNKNYIQELYVQLHLQKLHSVSALQRPIAPSETEGALRTFNSCPSVVCINLVVPGSSLDFFSNIPRQKLLTPNLHCTIQSSPTYRGRPWQNIFATIHLTFGKLQLVESEGELRASIAEDKNRWSGTSPLIVSFVVPSWVVLLEPRNAIVAIGMQSTPHSVLVFGKHLGLELNFFKTTLANSDHVCITKYRPNLSNHCIFGAGECIEEEATYSIAYGLDTACHRIVTMEKRIEIKPGKLNDLLKSGIKVETLHTAPCTVEARLGKASLSFDFPVPIQRVVATRVARKSSYIEISASLADPRTGSDVQMFMHPMIVGKVPRLWNIPYLNLDSLPILDISSKKRLGWLTTHASFMWSSRERRQVEASRLSPGPVYMDPRTNLKDSLFSLFMQFSGVQGRKARIFGLNHQNGGGVQILIFVYALRLDLSNRTVVLDCAVLPLFDDLMPKITVFLQEVTGQSLMEIKVEKEELQLWKMVLPAWVERCRTWEHRDSCEFIKSGKAPISIERGEPPICSCGNGHLPQSENFGLKKWNRAARYAVRAAISPSFSVPFVEKGFEGRKEERKQDKKKAGTGCQICGRERAAESDKELLKCARCQSVRYCSTECQRSDWPAHKKNCKKS